MDQAYGAFHDKDACFPDDLRHLTIPKSITGIDRVVRTEQLNDMLKRENKALFCARFYRDRCFDLEQHCGLLEIEKVPDISEETKYYKTSVEVVKCY